MTKSPATSDVLQSGWPSLSENLQVPLNKQEENPGYHALEMALRRLCCCCPGDLLEKSACENWGFLGAVTSPQHLLPRQRGDRGLSRESSSYFGQNQHKTK